MNTHDAQPRSAQRSWRWSLMLVGLAAGVSLVLVLVTLVALRMGALLPSAGEIAYYASDEGRVDIYVADVGHALSWNLTRSRVSELAPAWSPDGTQIAYMSARGRDGDMDIFVMDADGRNARRITHAKSEDSNPVWSPDGTRIAYEAVERGVKIIRIREVNADGNRAVSNGAHSSYHLRPVWSPDGARIAFYADDRRDPELFIFDIGERHPLRLTSNPFNDWNPVWSPDGEQIAFYSNRDGDLELYLINGDCADHDDGCEHATPLTSNDTADWLPQWSPDGSQLAYLSEREREAHIFTVPSSCAVDGATCDERMVSAMAVHTGGNDMLAWSPEGERIAFVSRMQVIHVVAVDCPGDPDACRAVPVSPASIRARGPVWRP